MPVFIIAPSQNLMQYVRLICACIYLLKKLIKSHFMPLFLKVCVENFHTRHSCAGYC